ncbi:MAG: hypothetical protein IJ794_04505 [Lachnospiraceae bacterium]|nr:hypothetical protein [Lachnospiraceae bacterium]
MPSQEEYLDSLLRGMTNNTTDDVGADSVNTSLDTDAYAEEADLTEPDAEPQSVMRVSDLYSAEEEDLDFYDDEDSIWEKGRIQVQDTAHMSEEDIERLLTAGEEDDNIVEAAQEPVDNDLMDILENMEDNELHEIHDLLHKSDNNEAIDDEIFSHGQEEVEIFDPFAEGEEEQPVELSEREKKALEKKKLKEEKKAAKAAQIEAQRAEKEAAKAAKQAEVKSAKAAKQAEAKAAREALKEKKRAEKEARKAAKMPKEEPKDQELLEEVVEEPALEIPDEDLSLLDGILQGAEEPEMPILQTDDMTMEPLQEDAAVSELMPDDDVQAMSELLGDIQEVEEVDGSADNEILSQSSEAAEDAELVELLQMAGAMDMAATLAEKGSGDSEHTEDTEENQDAAKEEKDAPKKGFFAKILDFLTEEDEEEDKDAPEIQLSDENQNILNELDEQEDTKGKKGKKKKKGEKSDKKKEKPKKEKVKKEKAPRKPMKLEAVESDTSGSNLSFKKILPVALVSLTLGVAIFVVTNLLSDFSVKKAGRDAYYNGDYQTCYEDLYGRDLNSSEQIMFSKSESILRIRLWISEYEMFEKDGLEMEALDSLIQSVNEYPALYNYAVEWNAGSDVMQYYQQILSVLSDKYHLTEAQALEIAAVPDDVEYTRRIHIIVEGGDFGSWDEPVVKEEPTPKALPDILPEEEGLGEIPLVDNL